MKPSDPFVADLLSRIPLSARTVLDVGCGRGALAAACRPFNPAARWLGIDRDPAATKLATAYFQDIATADVEADPMPFDVPEGIDCVIYRSVLARLSDPWALVRRHAEALGPDGMMLICLPNPAYWRLTESLLRGRYDSGETECLPSRWYGAASMRRRIARAGLFLCDVMERGADRKAATRFVETIGPALNALDVDPADYVRRAAASHLIWRVSKQPRQRVILSGNMLTPVGGVSDVRVVNPMRALAAEPGLCCEVTDRADLRLPADGVPRIFILHRPALTGRQGQEFLRALTDAGHLVVTEFDDHPDHFKMMRMGGEMSFSGVHALQTSTTAMAEALRPYNTEIAVFPNALAALPEIRNFTDPACLTLFFGALNREAEWRRLMPAINGIAKVANGRLRFQVVHDRGFFDALETPHKTFTPTCDYDTYLHILGGCEISFMPLSDTIFNRCKSDLKFIEAGSCRVAALASAVVYADSMDDGVNGLLFRDPAAFSAQLLRLVSNPDLARALGDAARHYVAQHRMLAYQVAPRIAWYRSLWARRNVLDEALRNRRLRQVSLVASCQLPR